jgi:hypothetical protein
VNYVIEDEHGVALELIRLENGIVIQHGNTVDPCTEIGRVTVNVNDLPTLIAWLAAASTELGRTITVKTLIIALCLAAMPAWAQSPTFWGRKDPKPTQEERIDALEKRVQALERLPACDAVQSGPCIKREPSIR